MKAIVAQAGSVVFRDVDRPTPTASQVLIKVEVASLNRADLIMISGQANSSHGSLVPGLEWAGEIVETGADVPDSLRAGQRVLATGSGGFAEYAVADWGRVIPMPEQLTQEQAVALPIALMTMHDAIVTNGHMKAGDSVMIQGASSGVGAVGIQVAKLMGAGLVIGTSTRPERHADIAGYGADVVVDSRDRNWVEKVRSLTDSKGVDLIVDLVSAGVMNDNMKAASVLGRIVNVGRLGGFSGEFDFDLHALKRLTYVGVTFRTRSVEEVRAIVNAMQRDLWQHVGSGNINLPVDKVYSFTDAREALDRMAKNQHRGKIVLRSSWN